jgi:hypothetical protein
VAEEITSICADFLVELRGFEPLTSAEPAPVHVTARPLPRANTAEARLPIRL